MNDTNTQKPSSQEEEPQLWRKVANAAVSLAVCAERQQSKDVAEAALNLGKLAQILYDLDI